MGDSDITMVENTERPEVQEYVLLIEDDPMLVDALTMGLSREGFSVAAAASGGDGIALARTTRPSIIILDLVLPDMPGEEVCKRLRAESDVPIMVTSGRGEIESRVNLLQVGADDYIVKPFGFIELLARLRAILRRTSQPGSDGR